MQQRHFHIRIQNPEQIFKEISEQKPFVHIARRSEDIFIKPFDIEAPEEYETSKHKKFPKCCSFHKTVSSQAKEWFEGFPNCCATHKKYAKEWWFKKANYENLPAKILNQLSYTEFHILKHVNAENWYKEITDYIEYHIESFGQPSVGFNFYITYLKHYINHPAKLNPLYKEKLKKEKLIEYIERLFIKEEIQKTDLNVLHVTYQRWIKALPLELEIFPELKKKLLTQFPIFKSNLEHNPYLGTAKGKARTRTELIEFLTDATKSIFDRIDLPDLVQKGIISDFDKINIEIINQEYRLKNDELLEKVSNGEKEYRNLIKKWLVIGKDYLKEIKPFLSKINQETAKNIPSPKVNDLTQRQVALKYRYLVLAGEHVPITVGNRNEIAEKYGFTSPTSGQKLYDWFNKLNTTNQRTAKGKTVVRDIKKVIEVLQKDNFSKATNLAEDELKIAKVKN